MGLYPDSAYPIHQDLAGEHATQWEKLSAPGSWGTGAQRLAVAREARAAGIEAGLLEAPADGGAESDADLPEMARRVVRKLAVAPKDFLQADYDEARRGGLSDPEYVELVGMVSRVTAMDIFARGIGVELRAFAPAGAGEPSREKSAAAVVEQAWVPTVPNLPDGGADAETLYGDKPKPYIMRSVSLVPEEYRDHIALEGVQYMPLARVMTYDFQYHEGLTRPQVEVVAGRVSALNECFYWTVGHARFLRESGRATDLKVNPEALVRPELDTGVPGGALLLAFADAIIGADRAALDAARAALEGELGSAAVSGAAAVAANFSKNDRIANGLGIPVDDVVLKATGELRAQLGLDSYRSAANTFRHYPAA